MFSFLRYLTFLLFLSGMACPLYAQTPDSTQTPPDTLLTPDSLASRIPPPLNRDTTATPIILVGFLNTEPGDTLVTPLPVRHSSLEAQEMLSEVPGTFLYDFGSVGWPDGWSPNGLDPGRISLLLNGMPFNDLITGRPRYDLLPLAFSERLRLQPTRYGTTTAVHSQIRAFDVDRPLTEGRYWASNKGLQSITFMHAQQRNLRLFRQAGRLNIMFGYGGHGNNAEYPGSRLERARQLYGRLRYEQANWSLDITEYANRRRVGAQGGVLPISGQDYTSIFQRFGATVDNPNAKRQTIRNDLSATFRARLIPGHTRPTTLSGYWISETFQYQNADTTKARMDRYGLRLRQEIPLAGAPVLLNVEGWHDRPGNSNAYSDSTSLTRNEWHLSARDARRLGRLASTLEFGLHAVDGANFPSGFLGLALPGRRGRIFAEVSYTGRRVSWVERYGFGDYLRPQHPRPDSRVTQARLGFDLRLGTFDLSLSGFANQTTNPLDLYVEPLTISTNVITPSDTVAALVANTAFRKAGAAADIGWRRNAEGGFYLTVQPSVIRFLNSKDSALHERAAAALPTFYGRARFGARFILFKNDLDLDIYLQGRLWTSMRSRTLHPQTGLLVLPTADALTFPTWTTLDVVVEAGVRTATLFLALDNILSGTTLMPGNIIVPDYPLPQLRFRFGIFWPIWN